MTENFVSLNSIRYLYWNLLFNTFSKFPSNLHETSCMILLLEFQNIKEAHYLVERCEYVYLQNFYEICIFRKSSRMIGNEDLTSPISI